MFLTQDVIKVLIMERFDHATKVAAEPHPTVETPYSSTNGHVKSESKPSATPSRTTTTQTPSSPPSDSEEDISPPKKKRKIPKSEPIDDAKLARMLQEQENRGSRATRGGNVKGGKVVKKGKGKGTPKRPRKKSEKKVKAEDDSGLEEVGSDGEVKEKPRKGGFHKQYHLSAPLADLVGESTVSLLNLYCPFPELLIVFVGYWEFWLIEVAITSSNGQKDMGIYQSKRPSRSGRQAADYV